MLSDIVYFIQLKPVKSWPSCRKHEFCLVPWCSVVFVVRVCDKDNLCSCEQIQFLLLMYYSTGAGAGCMELFPELSRGCPYSFYSAVLQADPGVPFSANASPGAGCAAELPSACSILITECILKLFIYPFRLFMSWSYMCLVLVRTLLCRKMRRECGNFFVCFAN